MPNFIRYISLMMLLSCSITIQAITPQIPANNGSETITFDGKLDETIWKNVSGGMLTGFQNGDKQAENTTFYLYKNGGYLYIGGTVDQTHLDPIVNKLNTVEATGTVDNSPKIYNDDCIELFVAIPNADQYIHFSFNQIGKKIVEQNTAYGVGKALNDKDIKVKINQNQRSWNFEAVIPLTIFGSATPDELLFNICRNNNPKGELSAWSIPKNNFHDVQAFGKIKFSNANLLIVPTKANNSDGIMELSLRLGKGDYKITGTLTENLIVNAKNKRLVALQGIPDTNSGITQIAVYNKAGDELLWSTPPFNLSSSLANITLDLSFKGASTLFINGKSNLNANDKLQKNINLSGKSNTIAITVDAIDDTPLTGTIKVGDLTINADELIYSNKESDNWTEVEFDDSRWRLAKKAKMAKGKRFYRYNIMRNFSTFAPQRPDGQLFLSNKAYDQWTLRISSPRATDLADYEVNFVLPKEMTIPRYDVEKRSYNRYNNKLIKTADEQTQTWKFSYDEPIPPLPWNWGYNVLNFVVRPEFETAQENKNFPVKVYQKGRGFIEYPQTLQLTILPKLQTKMPKNIKIVQWELERNNCYSVEEIGLMLETFRDSGVNYCGLMTTRRLAADKETLKTIKQLGMKSLTTHFGPDSVFLESRPKDLPPIPHVNPINPRPIWAKGVCPEAFMTDPWITEYLTWAAQCGDGVEDDMERGYKHLCFCETCMARITKFIGLSQPVSVEELHKTYKNELIKYNMDLNERVVKYQAELIKKVNPNAIFTIYSGYDSLFAPESYGIDWKRFKNLLDTPIIGYDLNGTIIKKTREALGGQKIICGYILDSGQYEKPLTNQYITAILFHQLRNSGFGGVLVWMFRDLDGRGWQAQSKFANGVAEFEDFLDEEKQISAPYPEVTVYKHNNEYLYMAINTTSNPKLFALQLPSSLKNATANDFYAGTTKKITQNFNIIVPPQEVVLLKVTGE